MSWKVFFWIYLLFAALSFLDLPSSPKLIDLIGYPIGIVELLGLFSFSFKKKILSAQHWKILFWVYIIFFVSFLLGALSFSTNIFQILQSSRLEVLGYTERVLTIVVTVILFTPFIYVLNKLAYSKSSKNKF